MQNILILDDSKLITTVLRKRVESTGLFNAYFAHTFAEAKQLIKEHSFFIAVVDLELPDSVEYEALDYIIAEGIPSIVLTGTVDPQVKEIIKSKRIVDYIIKNSRIDIESCIEVAEKLLYFKNKKVLVVDDSMVIRMLIEHYLKDLLFEVFHATDGQEALEVLLKDPSIDMVITDYNMGVMDGMVLTQKLRSKEEFNNLIILAMTSGSEYEVATQFLKYGADDFIHKPILKEAFNNRIYSMMRSKKQIESIDTYVKVINSHVITASTDETGIIRSVSEAFCKISGYSKEELIGKNHSMLSTRSLPALFYSRMWKILNAGRKWQGEFCNRHKDGTKYWVKTVIEPLLDFNGNIEGYTAISTDISDKKQAEEASTTDRLTGIYNRVKLDEILKNEEFRFKRYDSDFSIILLDIDKFKNINDEYGHLVGDNVLKELSTFVCNNLRENDFFGRWGGEEFLLVCPDTALESAEMLAENLRMYIEAHCFSDIETLTCSFGVATFTKIDDLESLLKRADDGLYKAKEMGRNEVVSV